MLNDADATGALSTREESAEKKIEPPGLVRSHPLCSEPSGDLPKGTTDQQPAIRPAFMVRDERFTALHPRFVFSRLRRRGSYTFHC